MYGGEKSERKKYFLPYYKMAKSVQKTCTPLLTFEEYESEIKKIENTRLGSTIPIIKVEYSRVFLAVVGFFLVGFIYSFVRQFKDMIIYDAFNDASLSVWFELLSFLCSYYLHKMYSSLLLLSFLFYCTRY